MELFFEESTPEVNINKILDEYESIIPVVKKLKEFKSFEIGFKPINIQGYSEWYGIPKLLANKLEELEVTDVYTNAETVDWTVYYKLVLESPTTIRGTNIFLRQFNVELGKQEKSHVANCIKGKSEHEIFSIE